jgi:hypothetical protein
MSSGVHQFAATVALPRTAPPLGSKASVYQFPVRQDVDLLPGNGRGALRGAAYALLAEGSVALAIYVVWHLWHVMR